MALGDGIRRNIATVSKDERTIFRDAILALDTKFYPDGVSYWDKQDQIHQLNHIHGGPNFLPFHRNLLSKFEELLREFNPKLSLHYWDYMTDPRKNPDGKGGYVNLFASGEDGFMGNPSGDIGTPLDKLTNKGELKGSRDQTGRPQDPPMRITRNVGNNPIINYPEETLIMSADSAPKDQQYAIYNPDLSGLTTQACEYIGGTIGGVVHKGFQDPFIFLIYSNTDRLWASWQLQKNFKNWRLEPEVIYGKLSNDSLITDYMEPWAGSINDPEKKISPWGIQWKPELINCKDPTVITPPKYDKYGGDAEP